MGRARNKRHNPSAADSFHITSTQLNIRASITARQVLEGVLVLTEHLNNRGPTLVGNALGQEKNSLAVVVSWQFSTPEPGQEPKPDVIIQFSPLLTLEKGFLAVTPYIAPWDFPDKADITSKVQDAIAQIQTEFHDSTKRVVSDLRGGDMYV